jgi:hypothetical protein
VQVEGALVQIDLGEGQTGEGGGGGV